MRAAADTIAAIATAVGGGIGIIRISGPEAAAIGRRIFPSLPKDVVSHHLYHGAIVDPRALEPVDEAMVVHMRAPRSYTGEDVVELHAHGGAANLRRVLEIVLGAGARLATPGEFTRRAFEAGRLDLTEVEAIGAIIGAGETASLVAAQRMRRGWLGKRVDSARRQIVAELAELEGALDFPEDTLADARTPSEASLRTLADELAAVARSYRRPLGVTPEVMLLGRVNAGKSSLLNRLVGRERALVDEAAGTTRDLIEAELELPGLVVRLIDTAGERDKATGIEARGQALARARRKEVALAILVIDAEIGMQVLEQRLLAEVTAEGIPLLVVVNKIDRMRGPVAHRGVSAKSGEGIDELRAAIEAMLALPAEEHALGSARQAEAFGSAATSILLAADALRDGAADAAAVELRRTLHHLGQITGETASAEVLDAIFSRFCIGK